MASVSSGSSTMTVWKRRFEGLVLLEVLLILVERRRTDGTQFATCQGRLEDVGGVHGALATTGSHERVDLVDEEE